MNVIPLREAFSRHFHAVPSIISAAPGRINIIGEHTDYNDGFVLPASIDKEAVCCLQKNDLGSIRLVAHDLEQQEEHFLTSLAPSTNQWANYLLGVVDELLKHNHQIGGFDCLFSCDVPVGAGLSSSAAIESAFVTGLSQLFNLGLSSWERVFIGQAAENGFVGANTGMLDQFASIFGDANKALLLDCRDRAVSKHDVQLPEYAFVVLNTGVKHNHVESGYADRRADCERAVQTLQTFGWDGHSLRDLTMEELIRFSVHLDENAAKRARFIVEENERVHNVITALSSGDAGTVGKNLLAGHWGLSRQYEVSCPESDFIVKQAMESHTCMGARQMGGGFGGCVLVLLKQGSERFFVNECAARYKEKFAVDLEELPIKIGPGARIIEEHGL